MSPPTSEGHEGRLFPQNDPCLESSAEPCNNNFKKFGYSPGDPRPTAVRSIPQISRSKTDLRATVRFLLSPGSGWPNEHKSDYQGTVVCRSAR